VGRSWRLRQLVRGPGYGSDPDLRRAGRRRSLAVAVQRCGDFNGTALRAVEEINQDGTWSPACSFPPHRTFPARPAAHPERRHQLHQPPHHRGRGHWWSGMPCSL